MNLTIGINGWLGKIQWNRIAWKIKILQQLKRRRYY